MRSQPPLGAPASAPPLADWGRRRRGAQGVIIKHLCLRKLREGGNGVTAFVDFDTVEEATQVRGEGSLPTYGVSVIVASPHARRAAIPRARAPLSARPRRCSTDWTTSTSPDTPASA